MPSFATLRAIGGGAKAAGQSLQELIAQRFAEQKQRELLAHQEAQLEQERRESEALSQHHRAMETAAQESATSLAGTRSATEASTRAARERADAAEARRLAALAELNAMTPEKWEVTPQYRRYSLINEAHGGGSPPSGVIETAKERQEREAATRQQTFDERADLIRLTASLRPEPQGPQGPREVPPELARRLVDIYDKYPDINDGKKVFKWYKDRGEFDVYGEDVNLLKAEEQLMKLYRTGKLAGTKRTIFDAREWFKGSPEPSAPPAPKPPSVKLKSAPIIVNGFEVEPLNGR